MEKKKNKKKKKNIKFVKGLKVDDIFLTEDNIPFKVISFPTRYFVCGVNVDARPEEPINCKLAISKVTKVTEDQLGLAVPTHRWKNIAEIIPMEEFVKRCRDRLLMDMTGYGYYASEFKMTYRTVFPRNVLENTYDRRYTHVLWFNKQ